MIDINPNLICKEGLWFQIIIQDYGTNLPWIKILLNQPNQDFDEGASLGRNPQNLNFQFFLPKNHTQGHKPTITI